MLGQSSSENAKAVGMLAESIAEIGWNLACKETEGDNGSRGGGPGGDRTVSSPRRMYSTSSHAATTAGRMITNSLTLCARRICTFFTHCNCGPFKRGSCRCWKT